VWICPMGTFVSGRTGHADVTHARREEPSWNGTTGPLTEWEPL
jgi:hypothetical protein